MGHFYLELSNIIEKLKFRGNFFDLSVGGLSCNARRYNRFTIGVDGLISKCDESTDDLGIGQLNSNGTMILDDVNNIEWNKGVISSPKCDNCFYSCCCMMDPCPKSRIKQNFRDCPFSTSELEKLMIFFSKSYLIPEIR